MANEATAGFAVWTYSEETIQENAEALFGPATEDVEARRAARKAKLVDAKGDITPKGWDVVNEDIATLERNTLRWLAATFASVREEGHSDGELVGTLWYDPSHPLQQEIIDEGEADPIDLFDTGFEGLGSDAWDDVSDFGNILGGSVSFFDVHRLAELEDE